MTFGLGFGILTGSQHCKHTGNAKPFQALQKTHGQVLSMIAKDTDRGQVILPYRIGEEPPLAASTAFVVVRSVPGAAQNHHHRLPQNAQIGAEGHGPVVDIIEPHAPAKEHSLRSDTCHSPVRPGRMS
jgi:hypothetical protein